MIVQRASSLCLLLPRVVGRRVVRWKCPPECHAAMARRIVAMLAASCCILAAAGKPDMSCAACGLVVARLDSVLETAKGELELSKGTNEKRAASIDKVQKAQTKRWLKNEYGVALRAGVEEEVETVCGHDTLSTSKDLQGACRDFLEEHEEATVRAVLDGKGEEVCGTAVAGCSGEALTTAMAAHQRSRRSDPVPVKQWVGKGSNVRRLVSSTFSEFVMDERLDSAGERQGVNHVLVMLYHSEVCRVCYCAKAGGACVSRKYSTAVAEFYRLAAKLNQSSTARISVGEMDLRGNELPQPTELADPEGVQFALFIDRDKGTPKLAPAVGEPLLAELGLEALRNKLKQLAGTYLKDAARSEMTKLLSAEPKSPKAERTPKAAAAAAASPAESPASETTAGEVKVAAKPSPTDPPPRKSEKSEKSPPPRRKSERRRKDLPRREEECEACGLLVRELHGKLRATKGEMQLSRAAAARKEQKVDKVQKAQTKRWLKQEYSVALAASLEEHVDGLCEGSAFADAACSVNNSLPSWYHDDNPDERWTRDTPPLEERHCAFKRFQEFSEWSGSDGREERATLRLQCSDAAKGGCRSVVEEHVEAVMRAVLDSDIEGKPDTGVCVQLLPGCEPKRAACFAQEGAGASGGSAAAGEEADEEASAEAFFARSKEEL